jgi:hypothetical protein
LFLVLAGFTFAIAGEASRLVSGFGIIVPENFSFAEGEEKILRVL